MQRIDETKKWTDWCAMALLRFIELSQDERVVFYSILTLFRVHRYESMFLELKSHH